MTRKILSTMGLLALSIGVLFAQQQYAIEGAVRFNNNQEKSGMIRLATLYGTSQSFDFQEEKGGDWVTYSPEDVKSFSYGQTVLVSQETRLGPGLPLQKYFLKILSLGRLHLLAYEDQGADPEFFTTQPGLPCIKLKEEPTELHKQLGALMSDCKINDVINISKYEKQSLMSLFKAYNECTDGGNSSEPMVAYESLIQLRLGAGLLSGGQPITLSINPPLVFGEIEYWGTPAAPWVFALGLGISGYNMDVSYMVRDLSYTTFYYRQGRGISGFGSVGAKLQKRTDNGLLWRVGLGFEISKLLSFNGVYKVEYFHNDVFQSALEPTPQERIRETPIASRIYFQAELDYKRFGFGVRTFSGPTPKLEDFRGIYRLRGLYFTYRLTNGIKLSR